MAVATNIIVAVFLLKNRGVTKPGATTVMDAVADGVCPNIMITMNRGWMLPLRLYVGPKTLWPGS